MDRAIVQDTVWAGARVRTDTGIGGDLMLDHTRRGRRTGLTVLAAAGLAMWGILADLGLANHGDELAVRDILSGDPLGT